MATETISTRETARETSRDPLDDALADRLIEALKTGVRPEWVALACDVDPDALDAWLARGASETAPPHYAAFAARWYRIQAGMQARLVGVWIREALVKGN
jgi:hypothetical protein